ncbi:MAG: hypothetical protein ACK5Y2_09805 [Bdellovibrionales bacterium]
MRSDAIQNHKLKAKNILYLSSAAEEKDLQVEVFYVEELGFKKLRWMFTKRCGLKLFSIGIGTPSNKPADTQIRENVLSGRARVPETERKIIQSFKCLDSKKSS